MDGIDENIRQNKTQNQKQGNLINTKILIDLTQDLNLYTLGKQNN